MAVILLVRLLDETATFLPSGALEAFRADLGLTYAQAGLVLAAIGPGALFGGLFAAAADHHSRRAIAAGGAFGLAASLGAFAAAESFAVLLGAGFLLGVGATAMVDAAEVALVDLAGPDLRRCLARANLLATGGDLLGPGVIAGVAVLGLSWRIAMAAGAALLALYGLALAASPLPPPAAQQPAVDARQAPPMSVVRDPAVWLLGLIGVLMGPFDETLLGFTIALLERDRGASAATATVVAFVGVSGGLLAYAVLARRLEAVDDRPLLLTSAGLMTLGALTIAAVPVVAAVAAGAFVASVGLNLCWLAVQHRSLTLRPGQVGVTKAVLGVIDVTGWWIPPGIGLLADRLGLAPAMGAFVILGALTVVVVAASAKGLGPATVIDDVDRSR